MEGTPKRPVSKNTRDLFTISGVSSVDMSHSNLDSNVERLQTGYSVSTLPVKPVVVEPTTPIATPIRFLKSSAVLKESHVDSDMDSAAEVGEETVHTWTEFLPVEPVLEPV